MEKRERESIFFFSFFLHPFLTCLRYVLYHWSRAWGWWEGGLQYPIASGMTHPLSLLTFSLLHPPCLCSMWWEVRIKRLVTSSFSLSLSWFFLFLSVTISLLVFSLSVTTLFSHAIHYQIIYWSLNGNYSLFPIFFTTISNRAYNLFLFESQSFMKWTILSFSSSYYSLIFSLYFFSLSLHPIIQSFMKWTILSFSSSYYSLIFSLYFFLVSLYGWKLIRLMIWISSSD